MYASDIPLMLTRRELLHGAMLLVGATAVTAPADLWAKDAAATRFFSAAQFAVLDEVCEAIIPQTDTPGARGAGVPLAFDGLMRRWASAEHQLRFRALLDDIDAAAAAQAGKPLMKLAAEQRIGVIARYDAAKLPGDKTYAQFKELVLRLYYLSEPGATQELRYEHAPGVWEPAVKITPETRAWAGGGLF